MDRIIKHLFFAAIIMITFATTTSVASADQLGLDFSSAPQNLPANNWNLGYSFHVNNPVSIVGLGTFDNGSLTNFPSAQQVGLWDNSGTLLASAYNNNLSTQIGLWAFTSISPVTLTSGNDYVVGSQGDVLFFAGITAVTVDPRISFLTDLYALNFSQSPDPLVEPNITTGLTSPLSAGWFGGNIQISDTAPPVPEPSTLFLLGIGLASLGVLGRRARS